MLTTDDPLLMRRQDARGVITLTMNRPQAFNALSEAMLDALQTELDVIARDSSARLVVIAAAGKAFCAGHDLKEMRAEPSQQYYETLFAQCGRMMMAIQRLPVPVIAQVQGIATAAGCQLVAMCDLAVASADARFAVSGVNLGLFCATPSVALSRNLGRKQAFEMLVTGAFISAEQAMASVMSTVLSRLNAFLDSELEQILCFDSAIDAENLWIGRPLTITVFSGPERRRRWSDEERLEILNEAFAPGACVAEVARRPTISACRSSGARGGSADAHSAKEGGLRCSISRAIHSVLPVDPDDLGWGAPGWGACRPAGWRGMAGYSPAQGAPRQD